MNTQCGRCYIRCVSRGNSTNEGRRRALVFTTATPNIGLGLVNVRKLVVCGSSVDVRGSLGIEIG